MLTQETEQIIKNVIAQFFDDRRAFTAFEVSLEAKEQGVTERHRHMKEFIHNCDVLNDEINYGDYHKKLVPVGNQHQAFLYYHESYDPGCYVPLTDSSQNYSTAAVTSTVSAPTSTPTSTVSTPVSPSGTKTHKMASSGLMVPTKLMRSVGMSPGDIVYVVPQDQQLFITKEEPQLGSSSKRTVERNGDIRLRFGTLSSAKLLGDNFGIETSLFDGNPAIEVFNVDNNGVKL